MLSNLLLEDLIALKLEIAKKAVGMRLSGLPIYASVKRAVEEAVLNYALLTSKSQQEAASSLGLTKRRLFNILKRNGMKTTLS